MENVTGLLGKKNEKILKGVLKEFKKLGYVMHVKVLSSENYGVPQKRRRTIFIGNKNRYETSFPKVTHGIHDKLKPIVTVGDVFTNLCYRKNKIYNHDVDSAQITNDLIKKTNSKKFLKVRELDMRKMRKNYFQKTSGLE